MSAIVKTIEHNSMRGLGRSPLQQALSNADNALRVASMVPIAESDLTPHPMTIVIAEIENVRRYISVAIEESKQK